MLGGRWSSRAASISSWVASIATIAHNMPQAHLQMPSPRGNRRWRLLAAPDSRRRSSSWGNPSTTSLVFSTDNIVFLPIIDRSPARWVEAWCSFEGGGSSSWTVLDLVWPDTSTSGTDGDDGGHRCGDDGGGDGDGSGGDDGGCGCGFSGVVWNRIDFDRVRPDTRRSSNDGPNLPEGGSISIFPLGDARQHFLRRCRGYGGVVFGGELGYHCVPRLVVFR